MIEKGGVSPPHLHEYPSVIGTARCDRCPPAENQNIPVAINLQYAAFPDALFNADTSERAQPQRLVANRATSAPDHPNRDRRDVAGYRGPHWLCFHPFICTLGRSSQDGSASAGKVREHADSGLRMHFSSSPVGSLVFRYVFLSLLCAAATDKP